jgi:fluoride exporter
VNYVAVAAGGACGAVLRFAIGRALPTASGALPLSTLLVNVIGAFVLGVLLRGFPDLGGTTRLALTVGVCGGFTTFSTFSAELFALIEQQAWQRAALYAVASVAGSLLATWAGILLASRLAPASP